MRSRYHLNKLRIKENKKEERIEEESKKRVISEREYDEAILGSVDRKIGIIHKLENEVRISMRVYVDKRREKGYDDMRLVFYEDNGLVWYDVLSKKVGFVQDSSTEI